MINLKDESDVQIWCDYQEETRQTSASFFLRFRFSSFRTFLANVSNYYGESDTSGDGEGDGYGYSDGDGFGYGFGSGFGSGNGYGYGYGSSNGCGNGFGDGTS